MPDGLALDILKLIVNVHWGGPSEFAIGGTVRDTTAEGPMGVFYAEPGGETDEDKDWKNTRIDPGTPAPPAAVDEPALTPRTTGLRYNYLNAMVGGRIEVEGEDEEKVVLVAGGFRSYLISIDTNFGTGTVPGSYHYNFQTVATLFYSEDGGKTWTEASNPVTAPPGHGGNPAEPSGINVDVRVQHLAFDPATKTFYGDVIKSGNDTPDGKIFVERTLIESSDGKTWSARESNRVNLIGAGEWLSGFLNRIRFIENNGLTEVINTDADPKIKLTYETATVTPNALGGTLKLAPPWKIEAIDPPPGSESFSGPVTGVPYGEVTADGESPNKGMAYANGRFLIAGSLMATFDNTNWDVQAYISEDKGKTWKKTLDDSTTFITSDPYVDGGIGCAGSPGCAGA